MVSSAIAPVRATSPTLDHRARILGLAVGLLVGASVAVLAEVVDFGSFIGFQLPWAAATLLIGVFVGWSFGPAGGRADGTRAWLAIIAGQALLAIIAGSFTVATLGTFGLTVARTGDLGAIPVALYAGAGCALIGIVLFGWLAAPITLAAAVLWALLMAAVRRGLGR